MTGKHESPTQTMQLIRNLRLITDASKLSHDILSFIEEAADKLEELDERVAIMGEPYEDVYGDPQKLIISVDGDTYEEH